jgi:hypothetical protein
VLGERANFLRARAPIAMIVPKRRRHRTLSWAAQYGQTEVGPSEPAIARAPKRFPCPASRKKRRVRWGSNSPVKRAGAESHAGAIVCTPAIDTVRDRAAQRGPSPSDPHDTIIAAFDLVFTGI